MVHWNPRKRVFSGKITRRIPISGRRVNNFGDLLGPRVVRENLRRTGLREDLAAHNRRLVSVGSVMHLARDGDVVWGTGINGKHLRDVLPFTSIDIRAVRGPLTREVMIRRGHAVPEVYGDPGLLVGEFWPFLRDQEKRHSLTIVPNLNDRDAFGHSENVLDPRTDLESCLKRISQSEFVIGSSLHAIIIAESLGIPARLITSGVEPSFKYEDYYLGSGRAAYKSANDVRQALELGGEVPPVWDPKPLLRAFPADLWSGDKL